MTSSVRPPLATTVCGGSTCKLFRPLAGVSPADCRRSAEISREPVQRIGSADSEGCSGFTRGREGWGFTGSWLVRSWISRPSTSTHRTRGKRVATNHLRRDGRSVTRIPASVDRLSTSEKLPDSHNSPTNRMRDWHRHPVASPPKFISCLRLTTRPVSVASPPLSVCFRTRLPGVVLRLSNNLYTPDFSPLALCSKAQQGGC